MQKPLGSATAVVESATLGLLDPRSSRLSYGGRTFCFWHTYPRSLWHVFQDRLRWLLAPYGRGVVFAVVYNSGTPIAVHLQKDFGQQMHCNLSTVLLFTVDIIADLCETVFVTVSSTGRLLDASVGRTCDLGVL
ncbi:unnamed protein product [Toxocara canis]|uniref:Uncharacterized protein n=1 Tax=Toxocara canis TaxID=6265 RepID=A0A183U5P5_TOXCA|nr:unnamed protein product [Toxocara canis]